MWELSDVVPLFWISSLSTAVACGVCVGICVTLSSSLSSRIQNIIAFLVSLAPKLFSIWLSWTKRSLSVSVPDLYFYFWPMGTSSDKGTTCWLVVLLIPGIILTEIAFYHTSTCLKLWFVWWGERFLSAVTAQVFTLFENTKLIWVSMPYCSNLGVVHYIKPNKITNCLHYNLSVSALIIANGIPIV